MAKQARCKWTGKMIFVADAVFPFNAPECDLTDESIWPDVPWCPYDDQTVCPTFDGGVRMATRQRWIALFYDPKKNLQPDVRDYTLYGGGEGDPSNEGEIARWIFEEAIPPLGIVRMTREQEEIWFQQHGLAEFEFSALDKSMGARGYIHIFWVSD
jgi:hypothetical protein